MDNRRVPPKTKQQLLVVRNQPLEADAGFAVCSPQCHTSRPVVGRAFLIPTVCRAWCGVRLPPGSPRVHLHHALLVPTGMRILICAVQTRGKHGSECMTEGTQNQYAGEEYTSSASR